MKNEKFYCQKVCGSDSFSIDEWNQISKDLESTNLTKKEKNNILFPDACVNQCFDCIAIVGATRIKIQTLIKSTLK